MKDLTKILWKLFLESKGTRAVVVTTYPSKSFLHDNTVSLPDNRACSGGQHAVLNSVCYVKISDCCLEEEIRYTHVQSCSQLEHDIISMLQRQLLARRGQI